MSIRAVADAVGVTPPSIYLHFRDKDELIFSICERHFTRLDAFIEKEGAKASDPVESLILRGKAYVRFGIENPEQYRIPSILISHPHFPWPDNEKLIDHVLRLQCKGLTAEA